MKSSLFLFDSLLHILFLLNGRLSFNSDERLSKTSFIMSAGPSSYGTSLKSVMLPFFLTVSTVYTSPSISSFLILYKSILPLPFLGSSSKIFTRNGILSIESFFSFINSFLKAVRTVSFEESISPVVFIQSIGILSCVVLI